MLTSPQRGHRNDFPFHCKGELEELRFFSQETKITGLPLVSRRELNLALVTRLFVDENKRIEQASWSVRVLHIYMELCV